MRWVASLDCKWESIDPMAECRGEADKGKARDAAWANIM